jgi:ATP phosphoribosyltransferase regulatory subunit
MSGNKRNVPNGTRDIMFGEAKLFRKLENDLTELYESRGFTEIITPAIEYYDVFDAGSTLSQEQMYKLTAPDGRLLVLRADNTTPIARVASAKFENGTPVKLFYHQKVYRLSEGYKGRKSEIMQSGVEILGASGIHADLICMITAIETLSAFGGDFKLELGHVGFYNALVSELELDTEQAEKIRKLVEAKDANKISDYDKIKKIPFLFGGEEVFEQANKLADGNNEAQNALAYLKKLYTALCDAGYKDKIVIDLGIVHALDYYTGAVFKGYMAGAGEPVLAGGRYDTLVSKFDKDICATGFGVNISEVADTLIRENAMDISFTPVRELVYFDTVSLGNASKYVANTEGAELSPLSTKREAMEYVEKSEFSKLVCFENNEKTVFII